MSNHTIINQIESEIARLEQHLEELGDRKKRLMVAIRNHRKALRLLNPEPVGSDLPNRNPSVSVGKKDATALEEVNS